MHLTAPLALGVLKIDRPLAGGFLGLTALSGLRVVETAVAAVYSRLTVEKPNNRASPVEMHPFCLRHLPRRGRFALCLTFISYVMNRISEISRLQRLFPLWCLRHHLPPAVRWDYTPPRSNHFISISRHSIARTSPSGGSSAAGGDRGAFPTPPGRLYGFIQTGGAAAYHHPLNPVNLLNPLNLQGSFASLSFRNRIRRGSRSGRCCGWCRIQGLRRPVSMRSQRG